MKTLAHHWIATVVAIVATVAGLTIAAIPARAASGVDVCAQAAYDAGFRDSQLVTAIAVGMAESGCNPDAVNHNANGTTDYGLWQINSVHLGQNIGDANCWLTADCNARAAWVISNHGANWCPWNTYDSGICPSGVHNNRYKDYLGVAQDAANRVQQGGLVMVTSFVPTLSLFQCPQTFCNQGVANQNFPARDSILDACYLPGTAAGDDQNWHLLLDYADKHIGFARGQYLEGTQTTRSCVSTGTETGSGVPTLSLFQCPDTGCNQGAANQNGRDTLRDLCYLPFSGSATDQDWNFVLDANTLTAGYVRGQYLDAHSSQSCGSPAPVTPGVGIASGSGVPTLTLFQCPQAFCNQGVANQHGRDLLTDVCQLTGTGSGGDQDWNLVLDYGNREVGFVRGQYLDAKAGLDCGAVGIRTGSGVPTLTLYQCPDTGCNQGVANQNGRDALVDLCYLPGTAAGTDQEWHWVYDFGDGHTGWVRGQYLDTRSAQHC